MGGFLSVMNVLRDMKIGIFTSSNTGIWSNIRRYIHMYAQDLLLGKEPLLNSTNACPGGEFDNVKFPDLEMLDPFNGGIDKPDENEHTRFLHTPSVHVQRTIGTYTNVAYGNVTVYENATDQEIYMSYGPVAHWRLERTGEDLTFAGRATLPLWSLGVSRIEFKDCDGQPCGSVETSFEWEGPPTFYRNPRPEPEPNPPCSS